MDGSFPAVGYVRVSTADQADSGAGLEAQRTAIMAEAERRGWELGPIFEDAASGRSLLGRPGLGSAISLLEAGTAQSLIVAKLDRLSRSLMDFASLMERSKRHGWGIIALDLGVDTTSPSGELIASVLAVFAQYERRLIGERTRDALAVKRAEGIRLGRPRAVPKVVSDQIVELRLQGKSLRRIADTLTEEQVPTVQGGRRWYPSTVKCVLEYSGEYRSRTTEAGAPMSS